MLARGLQWQQDTVQLSCGGVPVGLEGPVRADHQDYPVRTIWHAVRRPARSRSREDGRETLLEREALNHHQITQGTCEI